MDQIPEIDFAEPETDDSSVQAPMSDDQVLAIARDEDMDSTDADVVVQARPEWGSVAMLAAAASFGASVPGAISSAYAELFRSVELNGEFSLSNGGGPLGQLTKQEIATEKQNDDDNDWTDALIAVAERRERREREEWAQSTHGFAGADLTGQQWGDLSQAVGKGGALREWLIERLMKDGKSRKDAEAKADEMAEIYRIMAIPESQRTPEQQKKIEKAKTDPDFERNTEPLAKQRDAHYGSDNKTEIEAVNANQSASVTAGADTLELFQSAPDLTDHHRQAVAASEPLENKKVPSVQVAAVAPPPQAPGGGFDG